MAHCCNFSCDLNCVVCRRLAWNWSAALATFEQERSSDFFFSVVLSFFPSFSFQGTWQQEEKMRKKILVYFFSLPRSRPDRTVQRVEGERRARIGAKKERRSQIFIVHCTFLQFPLPDRSNQSRDHLLLLSAIFVVSRVGVEPLICFAIDRLAIEDVQFWSNHRF